MRRTKAEKQAEHAELVRGLEAMRGQVESMENEMESMAAAQTAEMAALRETAQAAAADRAELEELRARAAEAELMRARSSEVDTLRPRSAAAEAEPTTPAHGDEGADLGELLDRGAPRDSEQARERWLRRSPHALAERYDACVSLSSLAQSSSSKIARMTSPAEPLQSRSFGQTSQLV